MKRCETMSNALNRLLVSLSLLCAYFIFVFMADCVLAKTPLNPESSLAQDNANISTSKKTDTPPIKRVFEIRPPDQWVSNPSAAQDSSILAAFHPKQSTWQDSDRVIYINALPKSRKTPSTLEKVISQDLADFQKEAPKLTITHGNSVITKGWKPAEIYYLSGDKHQNYEAVAYIEEPTAFMMIVLNSRNKAAFDNALETFEHLVMSYQLLP